MNKERVICECGIQSRKKQSWLYCWFWFKVGISNVLRISGRGFAKRVGYARLALSTVFVVKAKSKVTRLSLAFAFWLDSSQERPPLGRLFRSRQLRLPRRHPCERTDLQMASVQNEFLRLFSFFVDNGLAIVFSRCRRWPVHMSKNFLEWVFYFIPEWTMLGVNYSITYCIYCRQKSEELNLYLFFLLLWSFWFLYEMHSIYFTWEIVYTG